MDDECLSDHRSIHKQLGFTLEHMATVLHGNENNVLVPWLKMDAVPCSWNTTRVQESFARSKPASDTLTKLAKLVAQKQDSQSQNQLLPDVCPCVCAQCSQGFSDMAELLHHQQGEHALRKCHCCLSCGKEFSLLSSLQLHKCMRDAAPCQVCCGKTQLGAPCSACKASTSDSQSVRDNRSYACAPSLAKSNLCFAISRLAVVNLPRELQKLSALPRTLPRLNLPSWTPLPLTLPQLMPLVPQILTGQVNAHFAPRGFAQGLALHAISDPPIGRSGSSPSVLY
ncbi:unnamed protein product [Oncorhynchus mykiss]|uniref:C2H2-type domain-containing protein n=1 Tax=Oncorhynchus mykiss TaxID=8022 RepID=A0A060Y4M0_ONCMY|nr:unnamed protein product [Oncorhynchus mykiss]